MSLHFAELAVRFAVGAALVHYAPRMWMPIFFSVFGWIVLATTSLLFFLPWRWHQRFAEQSVPRALRYITLIGLASAALGVLMLASALS